jgi:hypothetical protein
MDSGVDYLMLVDHLLHKRPVQSDRGCDFNEQIDNLQPWSEFLYEGKNSRP